MRVIISADQESGALSHITKGKPAALLRVMGEPVIKRQLDAFLKAGFAPSDICVTCGGAVKDYVKEHFNGVKTSGCLPADGEGIIRITADSVFDAEYVRTLMNAGGATLYKGTGRFQINTPEDLYKAEKQLSEFSLKGKKAFIYDLDGTVYLSNTPIQNTVNFIRNYYSEYKFFFMTNNTSKNLDEYLAKLNGFGIPAEMDRILSPLIPLTDYMNENGIKRIYPVANESMKSYLKKTVPDVEFTSEAEKCQAVVLGFDTELTYEKLKTAALLLQDKNIKYLATHSDDVCPTDKGDIPDVGAFMALFQKTVKRMPELIFGKPNTILLSSILKEYKESELAVFGDRLYTDKLLANNAGIDFVLVLSGEAKREDVESLERFPELIIKDCGEF